MANNLLEIADARLIFKNFSGKPDIFSGSETPTFGVLIPAEAVVFDERIGKYFTRECDIIPEFASGIIAHKLKPRHEDDDPAYWLKIKINMDRDNPPKIYVDRAGEKSRLTKETIKVLDYADIDKASMQLSVYNWSMAGSSGRSLYLKNLICFINENDFMSKYDISDDFD